ncbi:DNA-binding transcriptional MerR regulator [Paenibacillus rhizosphaerae]|uniref:DNA-binding transcriptional MerR regulator n=1 Tax=Paenibacillus rhizosphaerae TaxID=297318 RepID=A0A839TV68_9BACL|nr:MerR family transcriptional regulator [Paenibacillus rhizosphaerae]MBB3131054.1 DNA-binding transcriptional MerR regulator [Paenibacillus rhizosphaerae]
MDNKFSSKQVSEKTGLSIPTLRYYEQIGLIDGIERDEKGYRRYSESDIAWFEMIKYFRALDMPIREMQQFLALHHRENSTTSVRREFMESYRGKIIDQRKELEKTLKKIDHKIDLFKSLEASSSN